MEVVVSEVLARQRKQSIERVKELVNMGAEELKRLAARAVGERDHEALWELTAAYLTLDAEVSPNTLRSYRRGVLDLLEAWRDVKLLRPTRDRAQVYVRELGSPVVREDGTLRAGLSAATVHARLNAARALYRMLMWVGLVEVNPFDTVRAPRLGRSRREHVKEKAYTEDELRAMVHVATEQGAGEDGRALPPDWALLAVLYLGAHAGLRASEMVALRWRDVAFSEGYLTVVEGKGGKTARVRMSGSLKQVLRQLRAHQEARREASEHVVPWRSQSVIYRKLQAAWPVAMAYLAQELGLSVRDMPSFEGKGVHGLRHYTGVRLAREAGNLMVARDHLRHASVDTTEIYAGVADEAREVDDW